jgi:phage protein D
LTEENATLISARPHIRINGNQRADMEQAVIHMRVNLPFSGMSHAELRLVNWGNTNESGESGYAFQEIAHGDQIEILVSDTIIFAGDITAIEEVYGQGAPRLVLLMEDGLHKLAKQRKSRVFESVSVNDLVQSVLSDANLSGEIQVSSDTGVWHQLNETNLAFLQRILWPYGIAIRNQANNIRIKSEEQNAQAVDINTQSGVSLLRVTADLNHQYLSAEVKGFNLESDEQTEGTEEDSQSESGQDAKQLLNNLGWGSDDLLAYPFSRNQSEAGAWATAAFRKKSGEFLTGELIASGNAELTTGKQINLSGASERLNGKYHIVQTQHLFDTTNGFKTRLKITRSSWNQH